MPVIQFISVLLTIIVLIVSLRRMYVRPANAWLRIPVIFLGLHLVLFYSYVYAKSLGFIPVNSFLVVIDATSWSSVLRLQSIFTYLLLEIYGLRRDTLWTRG